MLSAAPVLLARFATLVLAGAALTVPTLLITPQLPHVQAVGAPHALAALKIRIAVLLLAAVLLQEHTSEMASKLWYVLRELAQSRNAALPTITAADLLAPAGTNSSQLQRRANVQHIHVQVDNAAASQRRVLRQTFSKARAPLA